MKDMELIEAFNKRDKHAFGIVYDRYYDVFCYFASKIFNGTDVLAEDIVQDIFISIWTTKDRKFNTIDGLKYYIYSSIKNKQKDYFKHNKHVMKYVSEVRQDDIYDYIVEGEFMSIITESLRILPEECARVFKLHVEGWDVMDIAKELNKTESTIYKQRRKSISIIKKKLDKDKLFILISMTNLMSYS